MYSTSIHGLITVEYLISCSTSINCGLFAFSSLLFGAQSNGEYSTLCSSLINSLLMFSSSPFVTSPALSNGVSGLFTLSSVYTGNGLLADEDAMTGAMRFVSTTLNGQVFSYCWGIPLNLLPIILLTENTVLHGFMDTWFFAASPINRPLLVKAT